jgi:hypothetical protein
MRVFWFVDAGQKCPLSNKGRGEEIWTEQTRILFVHAAQKTPPSTKGLPEAVRYA